MWMHHGLQHPQLYIESQTIVSKFIQPHLRALHCSRKLNKLQLSGRVINKWLAHSRGWSCSSFWQQTYGTPLASAMQDFNGKITQYITRLLPWAALGAIMDFHKWLMRFKAQWTVFPTLWLVGSEHTASKGQAHRACSQSSEFSLNISYLWNLDL